jgi:hypothetical protein
MDFIDQLRALAARVSRQIPMIATEEATKNALVMPFINALGYNVFDPGEVTPELNADVGVKKGEKVDYAVLKDGEVVMLFECKSVSTNLDKITPTQLFRYFAVTKARIGVLTNGLVYRFFSDLEEPNKMDTRPFLEFNLLDIEEPVVGELKKLSKSSFDQSAVLEAASELKYTREIKRVLADQLSAPSEDFVRFFIPHVYSGRVTQAVKDQFTPIVQRAFRHFVSDQVNDRLKTALERDLDADSTGGEPSITGVSSENTDAHEEIETTEAEREAFHIVRAILREVVDPARVVQRDVKSYFGILLDDNNRKPLARLHFNTSQKYIGLFDAGAKKEERVPISRLEDIYALSERLKATVAQYDGAGVP